MKEKYEFTEQELAEHDKEVIGQLYNYLHDKLYSNQISDSQIMYCINLYSKRLVNQ